MPHGAQTLLVPLRAAVRARIGGYDWSVWNAARMRLGLVSLCGFATAVALPDARAVFAQGPPAPGAVPAATLSPYDLYDAAYDRWKALPQSAYATYVTHIEVRRKDRVQKRLNRIAYRRSDNLCLTVGIALDARDRPDSPNVTDRCLAPDYAFTFVPQRNPGRGGPLQMNLASPAPQASAPTTIGHIRARARAYDISLAGEEECGVPCAHLVLRPVGDPGTHILRDVWVDRATGGVIRLHGTAPLFGPVASVDFVANYDEGPQSQTLTGVTGFAKAQMLLLKVGADFSFVNTGYAFPTALPQWYFEKNGYASHGRKLPPEGPASNTL